MSKNSDKEDLLAFVMGISRQELLLRQKQPTAEEKAHFDQLWERYQRGEPIQYLFGEVDFLGVSIKVGPEALIPRQETEILVDQIEVESGKTLFDVCSGTGCIGIALKKKYPDLRVILSDISEKALSLAKENAKRNQVDVEFLQGDLLAPFQGITANYIICNPPYVSEKEYETLDPKVREWEPKLALTAPERGLFFYRRLANELPAYLKKGGKAWFEIGAGQGEEILELFSGLNCHCEIKKDWAGHDRFFFLEIQ